MYIRAILTRCSWTLVQDTLDSCGALQACFSSFFQNWMVIDVYYRYKKTM